MSGTTHIWKIRHQVLQFFIYLRIMNSPYKDTPFLFVYGTLLYHAENIMSEYLSQKSSFHGKGFIYGQIYKVDYYPGATYDPSSSHQVFGDIVQLKNPQQVFEVLDHYEGYNANSPETSLFIREIIPVQIQDKVIHAWVYLFNRPTEEYPVIESGNYSESELEI